MSDGTILILNGTSSSGKTSIVHALQDLFDSPFLEAGIDKFIFMMPGRYLERPLWDDILGRANRTGESGRRLVRGMHHAIVALSREGVNVIADHVLVEPVWRIEAAELFADLPAYLIGVRCPLDVLEQRERLRRNRTLGQARLQHDAVHQDCIYDGEVDTSRLTPKECAAEVIDRVQSGPPVGLRSMRRKFRKASTS